ncbi:MAG: hypothetical protein SOZ22_00050 [Ezakiella sp.]|nr:hypothetical protein [Ezakiella sp.]
MNKYGYKSSTEIKKTDYEKMCEELEAINKKMEEEANKLLKEDGK